MTRHSINMSARTYDRARAHCDSQGISMSGYLETLLQDLPAAPPAGALAQAVREFCHAVDAAQEAAARCGHGGQHVPFHGDFAGANPGTLSTLAWWVRHFREQMR